MLKIRRIIELALFIVGTSVGGGALALPISVVDQGFFYGVAILFSVSLFALFSSFFILEAVISTNSKHLFSMFERSMSRPCSIFASYVYAFICFASLVAYIAGIGDLLCVYTGLSRIIAYSIVTAFHAFILSMSNDRSTKIGSWIANIMIICLFAVVFLLHKNFSTENFVLSSPNDLFSPFPIFMAAFSFQMVIPSIFDKKELKEDKFFYHKVLFWGIFLTALIYLIWMTIVFGIFPIGGDFGIKAAFQEAIPITKYALSDNTSKMVAPFLFSFAVCAMSSSFIGVGVGFVDFISDMCCVKYSKSSISLVVSVLSLFIAMSFQKMFLLALSASGGIGDSIIHGLMPAFIISKLMLRNEISKNKYVLYSLGLLIVSFVSIVGFFIEVRSYLSFWF